MFLHTLIGRARTLMVYACANRGDLASIISIDLFVVMVLNLAYS